MMTRILFSSYGLAAACLAACLLAPVARAGVEKDLERAFEGAVLAALSDPAAQVTVGKVLCQRAGLLKRAKGIRRFDLQPTLRPFGRVSAQVEFELGRGMTESALVLADVDATAPVWVADGPIEAGVPLEGLVRAEARSLARIPSNAMRASVSLDGMVANRSIAPGAILSAQHAARPVLIRRGDRVGVTVVVGAVSVRAQGEALRDGRSGETVAVKTESGSVVSAVVQGRGQVMVTR